MADLARSQAQAGLYDLALQTALRIEDADYQTEALRDIAEMQAQAGLTEDALATFHRALQSNQRNTEPDEYFWGLETIAQAMIQSGMHEQALEIALQIEEVVERNKMLQTIAEAHAQAGLHDQALTIALQIETPENRCEALQTIAEAHAQAGLYDQALTIALQIETPENRCEALRTVAEAHAQAGMMEQARVVFEHALQTALSIPRGSFSWELSDSPRDESLEQLVKSQAQFGMYEMAFQTALMIEDLYTQTWALLILSDAQAENRHIENATKTVKLAFETALQITDALQRVHALSVLAFMQAMLDKLDDANTTLNLALQNAQKIEGFSIRNRQLASIAKLYLEAGLHEQASRIAAQIEELFNRQKILENIADAQAQAAQFPEAMRTVGLLAGESSDFFPELAMKMVEAGDRRYFKQLLLPCAYFKQAAMEMCAALIRAYPEQAEAIGEVVMEFVGAQGTDTEATEPAP
ncbi:MAG: hypothetical protein WHS44_07505 [Fimbriimonadales bacterium]